MFTAAAANSKRSTTRGVRIFFKVRSLRSGVLLIFTQDRVLSTVVLEPVEFRYGKLVLHVPGIQCGCRFEKQHLSFFIRDGPVLDTTRHYHKFTFFQPNFFLFAWFRGVVAVLAKLHAK